MSKPKSSKKNQQQTTSKTKSGSFRINSEKIFSYKYTGLIIAGFYFLVVGILSFTFHKVGDYGIETDFFWGYAPNAKNFLSGEIPMDAFRGPFYPIVLGL